MEDFDPIEITDTPETGSWRLPQVYRRLENGKTTFWEIGFDEQEGILLVKTGQTGGKVKEYEYDVEINTQLKTKQAKAIVDARYLFTLKIRKGYSIESEPQMGHYKPQLAHKFTPDKISFNQYRAGVACQPKADGIRSLCHLYNGAVMMLSREGVPHAFLSELKEQVRVFLNYLPPEVALDGELMVEGATFEELQSAVRATKNKSESNDRVKLFVFDIIHQGCLEERINILLNAFQDFTADNPDLDRIILMRQMYAFSQEEIDKYYQFFLDQGYEGLMIRKLWGGQNALFNGSLYTGYRNNNLLKYKPFDDDEAILVGILAGKNSGKNKAVFQLKTDDGIEFTLKPGTDQERIEYLKNPNRYIGRVVTYKHQGFFESGIPRFPTWLRFRDFD